MIQLLLKIFIIVIYNIIIINSAIPPIVVRLGQALCVFWVGGVSGRACPKTYKTHREPSQATL